MVYGKIVPPPTRVGSTIKGIDDSAAKQIDGYITTLPLNFPIQVKANAIPTALVIAENYPAAMRAAKLVKVDWESSDTSKVSSQDILTEAKKLLTQRSKGLAFVRDGNIDSAIKEASGTLKA